VDEPTGFDKNRGAIFGRRGLDAAVRSEAEDERPSPAAGNPTLSARKNERACFQAPLLSESESHPWVPALGIECVLALETNIEEPSVEEIVFIGEALV
jgi:hypothetical protein